MLDASVRLERRTGQKAFDLGTLINEVRVMDRFELPTIRAEICRCMCKNEADHHAVTNDELEQIARCRYKRTTTCSPLLGSLGSGPNYRNSGAS